MKVVRQALTQNKAKIRRWPAQTVE